MPRLTFFTNDQLDAIHATALEVLKNVGCEVQDKRWLEVLDKAGAKVDHKTSRVTIPTEELINSALDSCAREIKKLARNPNKDFILGEGYPRAHTPEGITHVIDRESKKRRLGTLSDLEELTRLCDALPNIDAVMCPVVVSDVPPIMQSILTTKTLIENTSKPLTPGGAALGRAFPFIAQMILSLVGDRDITEYSLGVGVTATSPLQFPPDQLDAYWQGVELGTPCSVGAMPQAGSTAPAPLAGMLVQFTAEILMGLVMGQIKQPGLPQFVYIRTCVINPRYGIFNSGNPEVGLIQAAATQLFKEKYRLAVNAGWAVSDSHMIGPQAAYEKAYTWLMTMYAGADMVSGIGGLSSGLTTSTTQVVIDDNILGHLRRGQAGILTDEFHLGLDMIKDVGIGGTYLDHPSTGRVLREERWFSELATRDTFETWEKAGSADLIQQADRKVLEILENHEVEPLDPELKETLDRVVKEAKKELL